MKEVQDLLVANFQSSLAPSRNLLVDETMVGFCGRFGTKQYMPKKPTKYGVKAFMLVEREHGYMLDILVYTGHEMLECASSQYSFLPQLLHEHSTCPGTCVKNRVGLLGPNCTKMFWLRNNKVQAYQCDELLMLSPEGSANSPRCSVVTRQVSTKPLFIHQYNLSMNDVDKAD